MENNIKTWIIVFVFFLIASCISFFVMIRGHSDKNPEAAQKALEAQKAAEEQIKNQEETADWKTYRNEKYGYEIKYPKDWYVIIGELPCAGCSALYEFEPNNKPEPGGIQISVTGSTTWDVAKENLERIIDGKSEDIVIDGVPAIKREGKATKYNVYIPQEGTNIEGIILMRNYRVYDFFTTKEDLQIFNQMLFTFKFAEPEFKSYTACGCGCCGGVEPTTVCLYHSKGDYIQEIIDNDKKTTQNPNCPQMGCSHPLKYIYCD
jgi:hypothetical protein